MKAVSAVSDPWSARKRRLLTIDYRSPITDHRPLTTEPPLMPDPTAARRLMVDSQLRDRGISDTRVLDAMLRVPRHEFVSEAKPCAGLRRSSASHRWTSQTISQPYIVCAQCSNLLQSRRTTRFSRSEPVPATLPRCSRNLLQTCFQNRTARVSRRERPQFFSLRLAIAMSMSSIGDGALGLPDSAPFDAILRFCRRSPFAPPALPAQLRDGGRNDYPPLDLSDSQQLQFIRMVNGQAVTSLRLNLCALYLWFPSGMKVASKKAAGTSERERDQKVSGSRLRTFCGRRNAQ